MYKLNIYFIDFIKIKQKNRTITKKVHRYVTTIKNIPKDNVNTEYIKAYYNYCRQYNCIKITQVNNNDNYDPYLHNKYIYKKNSMEYEKYIIPDNEIKNILDNTSDSFEYMVLYKMFK